MLRRTATVALLLAHIVAAQSATGRQELRPVDDGEATIEAKDIYRHLEFLASDEMKGRDTGSAEAKKAAEYITEHMKKAGLQPAGEKKGVYQARFSTLGRICQNVCGVLPGTDPRLRKQYVVVGAHYDHVGLGMRGSRSASGQGKIHNGADDNASGTSSLLELVDAFAKKPTKRSLLFLAFSGEELGLKGSQSWVKKPTRSLGSVVSMINLDMVGRSKDRYLFVGGVNTGSGFEKLVRKQNEPFGFNLELNGGGKAPSDNRSFYAKRVPVLFFFTAEHQQYHTPEDDIPLVNTADQAQITRLAYRIIRKIADTKKRPRFQKDDRYAMPAASQRGQDYARSLLGVRLGAADESSGGVAVQSVEKGGRGAKAGFKRGDILLSLDGYKAESKEAVQSVLAVKKKGSRVKVRILRKSKKLSTTVTL